jgi:cell wall-associated NlpC family hydrolase
MHRTTTSSRPTLPEDDGWAIFALVPGERDLGRIEYWEVSQERSRRRREAQRRPRIARSATATKASVALAAAAIGAPVAVGAATADTASAAASPTTTGSGNLNVRRGDKGPNVRTVQAKLGISVDGIFGPQTERAVKAFQRSHGLVVDGIVGPVTTRALGVNASAAKTISWKPMASITLSVDTIKAVQRQVGVAADGIVGPQTTAAVKSFEARWGLPADGRIDAAVLRALGITTSGTTHTVSYTGSGSSGSSSSSSGSTAGSSTSTSSSSTSSSQGVAAALAAMRTQLGKPYQWGGNGPNAWDCSGLVQWAFKQAGVSLPRTSFAMYGMGSAVSSGNIQAGDLVFFNTAGAGASHLGVAISSSQAISATSSGVMVHDFRSGYWGSHFVGARRVL